MHWCSCGPAAADAPGAVQPASGIASTAGRIPPLPSWPPEPALLRTAGAYLMSALSAISHAYALSSLRKVACRAGPAMGSKVPAPACPKNRRLAWACKALHIDEGIACTIFATQADSLKDTEGVLHDLLLQHLPPGRYLASLKVLDLEGNSFRCIPPALAAATSLTHLDLSCNQVCHSLHLVFRHHLFLCAS